MTINAGFTAAEIREFVHEYQVQPHGQKGSWLAQRDVSPWRLRRWREAVFEVTWTVGWSREMVVV